jgi:hypothetical protein
LLGLCPPFVGSRKQRRRDFEAKRLRGFQIDDQLIFGWHLHRQVGRFLALTDAIDVARSVPVLID